MTKVRKEDILEEVTKTFAMYGAEGVSVRKISKNLSISPAVMYYYFQDKEVMLREMFEYARSQLGLKRKLLESDQSFEKLLESRVRFQFENALLVCAVLKYFFDRREDFEENRLGYVPITAYRHMQEVLAWGVERGELSADLKIDRAAKFMTHAVNGFVLEYFPSELSVWEKDKLAEEITVFLRNSLGREVINK